MYSFFFFFFDTMYILPWLDNKKFVVAFVLLVQMFAKYVRMLNVHVIRTVYIHRHNRNINNLDLVNVSSKILLAGCSEKLGRFEGWEIFWTLSAIKISEPCTAGLLCMHWIVQTSSIFLVSKILSRLYWTIFWYLAIFSEHPVVFLQYYSCVILSL